MPYSRRGLELDASAAITLCDYVRDQHPGAYEKFLQDSGRTDQGWRTEVAAVTHNEWLGLARLVSGVAQSEDPELFLQVGEFITSNNDHPVVKGARLLGSPGLIVRAAAMASNPNLNSDSLLFLPFYNLDGGEGNALMGHANLGRVNQMYLRAKTTSAGYFRGIPKLWGLDPMQVRVVMLDMPLEQVLGEYAFTGVQWTKGEDGHFYEQRKAEPFAVAIGFDQAGFSTIEVEHAVYRMLHDVSIDRGETVREGEFLIGDPKRYRTLTLPTDAYKKIPLEKLGLVRATRDVVCGGVHVVREGMIYGGKTPAPFSLYSMQWEEPTNKRQWFFRVLFGIRDLFKGGSQLQLATDLAKKEQTLRVKAEDRLEDLVQTLAAATAREHQLIDEDLARRDELSQVLQGVLHSVRHLISGLELELGEAGAYVAAAGAAGLPEGEREEIFAKVGSLRELTEGYRKFLQERDANRKRGANPFHSLAGVNQVLGTVLNAGDRGRNDALADAVDGYMEWKEVTYPAAFERVRVTLGQEMEKIRVGERETFSFDQLWRERIDRFRVLARDVDIELEVPPQEMRANASRLGLVVENLVLNGLEAARSTKRPYLHVASSVTGDKRLRLLVTNTVRWEDEQAVDSVVAKLQSGERFSTKGKVGEGSNRGQGHQLIMKSLFLMGAGYEVRGSYTDGTLEQEITFPSESLILENAA